VVFVLLHNLSGYALGYWTGRLFRMDERDCRTMAIEVGMQNGGLASGLAMEMGKMATVGLAPQAAKGVYRLSGALAYLCRLSHYCCKTANPFGYEA
jgi:BASS family bile acid:Na+ symporter